MRRVRPSAVVSLVVSLTLVLVAGAFITPAHSRGRPAPTSSLLLLPTSVVPGPGDLAASGSFTWRTGRNEFDFALTVDGLAAQIQRITLHRGAAGLYGTEVLRLSPNDLGISELNGFVRADDALLREIKRSPQNFYIQVSTVTCPSGALRGQLKQ